MNFKNDVSLTDSSPKMSCLCRDQGFRENHKVNFPIVFYNLFSISGIFQSKERLGRFSAHGIAIVIKYYLSQFLICPSMTFSP
jgi:hypothetical protein